MALMGLNQRRAPGRMRPAARSDVSGRKPRRAMQGGGRVATSRRRCGQGAVCRCLLVFHASCHSPADSE